MFDARRLIGLSLARAKRLAGRNDCKVRVIERDGRQLVVTDDLEPNRVNVAVTDGRVTEVGPVS